MINGKWQMENVFASRRQIQAQQQKHLPFAICHISFSI
jgi:hypothetical protein